MPQLIQLDRKIAGFTVLTDAPPMQVIFNLLQFPDGDIRIVPSGIDRNTTNRGISIDGNTITIISARAGAVAKGKGAVAAGKHGIAIRGDYQGNLKLPGK